MLRKAPDAHAGRVSRDAAARRSGLCAVVEEGGWLPEQDSNLQPSG